MVCQELCFTLLLHAHQNSTQMLRRMQLQRRYLGENFYEGDNFHISELFAMAVLLNKGGQEV